jgi:putative ABC transport system substrate-binding protein
MTRHSPSLFDRRRLLLTLAAGLASPALLAQVRPGTVRIGYLPAGPDVAWQTWVDYLRSALSDLGYQEGRNLTLLIGRPDGTPAGMKQTLQLMRQQNPDLIVTFGNAPVQALRKSGMSVPVVMAFATDPQGTGLVSNLSRPGGMITGASSGVDAALLEKQLVSLRYLLPKLSRLLVLTSDPKTEKANLQVIVQLAKDMGIQARGYQARDRDELAGAFRTAKTQKAAILAWGDYPQSWMRQQLGQFGLVHKVPVVAVNRGYVEQGALCSVGVPEQWHFETAARYIRMILGGAKPGDLPIESPTATEFIINGRTAAALGIPLSHELRLRANEVIG